MKNNKMLIVNFVATMIAFLVNALINFFLSSYIVNSVGEEAYGFVQLANTFITYFTVITIAINSMSSRFISIEYYKKKFDSAKEYYSSTFWANIAIIIFTIPLILIFVLNIEKYIDISPDLIKDVKLLFLFLSANLYLGLLTTNLTVSYYIKNKLYISSFLNMLNYVIKAIILYFMYVNFSPYVAFVGVATFIAMVIIQIFNLYFKKKLIPEIKIGKFNFEKVKVLVSSGFWNSITRLGNILSEGLDLFIANIFLNSNVMGVLAIIKIIPNTISSVLSSLVTIFMPNMTEVYAKGSNEDFTYIVKKAMKFIGVLFNIPIICVIVLGGVLFNLWFPTLDANLLYILSILAITPWIVVGPLSVMHNVFTVINKIKVNSIVICLGGIVNVIIVYILLKLTNLGIFAIVGVSSLISVIRNILYTLPYSSKYMGVKCSYFLPEILKSLLSVIINIVIGFVIREVFNPVSWISLILTGITICVISFIINVMIFYNKDEIKRFIKGDVVNG